MQVRHSHFYCAFFFCLGFPVMHCHWISHSWPRALMHMLNLYEPGTFLVDVRSGPLWLLLPWSGDEEMQFWLGDSILSDQPSARASRNTHLFKYTNFI